MVIGLWGPWYVLSVICGGLVVCGGQWYVEVSGMRGQWYVVVSAMWGQWYGVFEVSGIFEVSSM